MRISHTDSEGRVFTHIYDDVICSTGFKMDDSMFEDSCKPEMILDRRFPALTAEWESQNVPGLFFCGALMQSRDFKRSSSAFIHGFRYNAKALFQMLSMRDGRQWPSFTIARDSETLTNSIAERINTTSSLWHQFNFLTDIVDLSHANARYYRDVPVAFAMTSPHFYFEHALMVTFTHDKPLNADLHRMFSKEPALHPCVRCLKKQQLVSEHHMLEDLEAEWFEDSLYMRPLQTYLNGIIEELSTS